MSVLREILINRIRTNGPINFEQFMDSALYEPGLGYYQQDRMPIGRKGDFYTSSHLHPIFGAMIGRQMEECWLALGNPNPFVVIEMGAGSGHCAKDILAYLSTRLIFQSLHYVIVERNPFAQAEQQTRLAVFGSHVRWINSLEDISDQVIGCFFGNELVDAFPVRVIQMDDGFEEIYVGQYNDEFVEVGRPCSQEVSHYLDLYAPDLSTIFRPGDRTEVNLRTAPWLEKISAKLLEGFVLTIDYGYPASDYYCSERNKGTLLCYHEHEVNDNPYQFVGEQDITAHVNFTALRRQGDDVGLHSIGYCPQGSYLISLGIDEVMLELAEHDAFSSARIKNLILPDGLGESHKVLMQYKGDREVNLRGFALRNLVKHLS
jgi:SAM-dependent MidA family methyltransferase